MTYVFNDACTACGACLLTCPEHAIVAGLPLRVRDDRCTGCGECVEICPADAILELPAPPPPIFALLRSATLGGTQEDEDRRERAGLA